MKVLVTGSAGFKDFQENDLKFDSYRETIKIQQSEFEKSVANLFIHND
jgi:hypothetical protein